MMAPGGAKECVEVTASDGWPPALPSNLCEGSSVAGEEVISSLLIRCSYITQCMDADLKCFWPVACAASGFPVEIYEWTETMWLSADDGDHEWQTELSGAHEGLRATADA
jgi:hypothetical protein